MKGRKGARLIEPVHCAVCGSARTRLLPPDWEALVDGGAAVPLVGCGNPFHYATATVGAPDAEAMGMARAKGFEEGGAYMLRRLAALGERLAAAPVDLSSVAEPERRDALLGTTDAMKWAEDFGERFAVSRRRDLPPGEPVDDQDGLMLGWFANAMQAGVADTVEKAVPAVPPPGSADAEAARAWLAENAPSWSLRSVIAGEYEPEGSARGPAETGAEVILARDCEPGQWAVAIGPTALDAVKAAVGQWLARP